MREALEPAGIEIVRGRFAWRRMLPPNASPMPDITDAGGWAALTGQQLWLVSSIFPFLLSPVFASPDSLVSVVEVLCNITGFDFGEFPWSPVERSGGCRCKNRRGASSI